MCTHVGGPWDIPNMDSEPGKARWLAKGNPEKMPRKRDSNLHEGKTLSLSRPPMPLSTRYSFSSIRKVLIKHFTSFTTFCLYVEIHFYIAAGPGPCHWALVPWGLVARIQRSHCRGLTSISSEQPKPCFKLLQAKGTWDYQIQMKLRTNGKVENMNKIETFSTTWREIIKQH